MTISLSEAVIALLVGAVLGGFFFGGLWLSVVRVVTHPKPWIILFLSLFVRFSVVLSGFYLLSHWPSPALLLALAGFVAARVLLSRRIAVPPAKPAVTDSGSTI